MGGWLQWGERETRGAKGDNGSAGKERKQAILRTVKAAVPVKPVSSCDTMHPGSRVLVAQPGKPRLREAGRLTQGLPPPLCPLHHPQLCGSHCLPGFATSPNHSPCPIGPPVICLPARCPGAFSKILHSLLKPLPWLTITFEITSTFLTTQSWPLSHPSPCLSSPPPPSAPD